MPEDQSTETEAVSNAKMSINDLKYIVMEGGGARGNTYLGAIEALENELFSRVDQYSLDSNLEIEIKPKEKPALTVGRLPGIMDYLKLDSTGENYIPIIEGVAGASAGAITTFALVLGLNSKEISEVLDFNFVNFLSEVDAGKYRMIAENSDLEIGEDKAVYLEDEIDVFEMSKAKSLGGKSKSFKYRLDANKTEIQGNVVKFAKRDLTVSLLFKVLIDGAIHNVGQVLKIISSNSKKNWYDKLLKNLFSNKLGQGGVVSDTTNVIVAKTLYSTVIKKGLFAFFNIKSGEIKVTGNTIAAIFKDRGMFSGFQVREFFYDLMILAATKDTYFQKRLIEFYNNEFHNFHNELIIGHKAPPNNLSFKDFEVRLKSNNSVVKFNIGNRGNYKFTDNAVALFTHLQDLTFREFWHLMKVEYAAAVSNFTTNSPLFFSDKYTPNSRILEAVASSMSIPPAIRPVYNAADVVFHVRANKSTDFFDDILFLPNKSYGKEKLIVNVNGVNTDFVIPKKNSNVASNNMTFTKSDYEIYEYAAKKGLQQFIKKKRNVFIDLNNLLELNTFLNYMQEIVIGNRNSKKPDEDLVWEPQKVNINGDVYVITIELVQFFYNAQFKGLLLDGGYFNNIPFNYFREKSDLNEIDGVLAIKLDGSFPPDFMYQVNEKMKRLKNKENEIIKRAKEEISRSPLEPIDFSERDEEFERIVIEIQAMFNAEVSKTQQKIQKSSLKELKTKFKDRRNEIKNIKGNREAILKIILAWYKDYGSHNNIKPWEIPRPIIDIAFTGYSYGSKRGQIRNLNDNNNLVPLYDFGVGTYDFDLKKVSSLADFAQTSAKIAIYDYFLDEP